MAPGRRWLAFRLDNCPSDQSEPVQTWRARLPGDRLMAENEPFSEYTVLDVLVSPQQLWKKNAAIYAFISGAINLHQMMVLYNGTGVWKILCDPGHESVH